MRGSKDRQDKRGSSSIKRQLLASLLDREGIGLSQRISKRKTHGPAPLSFAQQRLWFLDQLNPGSALYNCPKVVRLEGRLDLDVLERVINEIVRRHEVLRTRIEVEAGEPAQVIDAWEPRRLEVVDLTSVPPEEKEEAARRIASEEAETGFDLSHGPLLRVRALKLAEDEHVLLYTMSHIVSDAWSMEILTGEVGALYQAFSVGEPSPLAEAPIQYADFAVWQREWLKGEVLEEKLKYWRRQLAGIEDLALPADHPRPITWSYRGGRRRFVVERELTRKLRELSQREGATLFMAMLAGFDVLMSRYSGQEDVVIGTDIANRNRAEIEGLIGFFVNQLALRVEVRTGESFKELLKQVRDVCLEAYAHEDAPFEKLVEELRPERNLSRSPLFQAKLIWQNAPRERLELGAMSLVSNGGSELQLASEAQMARFDLLVSILDVGDDLVGVIEYSRDLFEPETIERLMGHYANALREIADGSERPISALNLLSGAEREQIVVGWNQTESPYPNDRPIHELFAEQVDRTPERIALIGGGKLVSYRELNRRANQLGSYLQRLGVGPGVVVGVCLERSVEMIVAILGVLKAGGAYLPLDPEFPAERLAFLLEDAGVRVALTHQRLEWDLQVFKQQTVLIAEEWEKVGGESECSQERGPASEVEAENLAYVIYTSGSTGKPKGVMVRHRSLVNYTIDICRRLGLEEGADGHGLRFATVSTITADLGNTCIYPSLLSGGCLHVLGYETAVDGVRFGEYLRHEPVDALKITPSHLKALLRSQPNGVKMLPQKYLILGGEALSYELVGRVMERGEGCEVINHYGPTETTIGSLTAKVCEADAGEWGSMSMPIGNPIANTRSYVLDREMNPVPIGARGELHIAGEGVARGYLGRPDLTAERFIPNLFSRNEGERLYRTGDVVRYLSDGNIRFEGRADKQVKINGFRIELGEIEATLAGSPEVREAVVVAREEEEGGKRLVAYYTGEEIGAETLRAHLATSLPEYMVPAAYVYLERLPLTPNGKLDRRALPAPEVRGAEERDDYLAPRTPLEEIVVGIFEEVLELKRVGRKDNFFDLGGHSLLAIQMISRIREMSGVEVEVKSVFERATAEGLSRTIEEAMRAGEKAAAPPLVRIDREGQRDRRAPLSFAQQRLWFIDQLDPGSAVYNIPGAVKLKGGLNLDALERVINEIVRRHEVLRTRFEVDAGEPAQVIDEWRPRRLEVIDLTSLTPEEKKAETGRRAKEETKTGFDLSRGPLLRVKVLKLEEDEHVLLYTMHHIVSDAWSMGILIEEVGTFYRSYLAGEEAPLPELDVHYADHAVWQRAYLAGEVLEREVGYWREQLKDAAVLELPTDRPRPAESSYRGGRMSIELGRPLSESLRILSRREEVTIFMTLMASFKALLMKYSGQEDISVGTVIANRTRKEIEGLIGFFVNTLVMRTDLSGNPSFRELVKREREVALGAYAHQELPFEKLVEDLNPERDLSRSSLFQVMMALRRAGRKTLELPGVKLGVVSDEVEAGGEGQAAKFDLTLSITDLGQELVGAVEYSRDLFEAGTIERLINHYTNLLGGVVRDSERPISELGLLSDQEREQVILEWNETASPYPENQRIHELFEQQAERTPEAVAVVFEGGCLSYGELNRRANQLARYLQRLGVGPEVVVGVCLEQSAEMAVGLLGALKSGGAYLPLDPTYPAERLNFMLQDAAVRFIVTQEKLGKLLDGIPAELICIDSGRDEIVREDDENVESEVESENLAYVIYTSGSTGRPKGTMIAHRSVVNLITDAVGEFRLGQESKFLQFASLSFDVAVEEIYPVWSVGGSVVLRPDNLMYSYSDLAKTIERHEVTTIELPTVYWREWVREMSRNVRRAPRSLDLVIIAGERVSPEILKEWKEHEVQLLHVYGVTEATVTSTAYLAPGDVVDGASLTEIPIGLPMANTEVYLLDGKLQPMPLRIPGEMHLGGAGLARGYLKKPELTAKRFAPSPFGKQPGARLYKSGDLARFSQEGWFEFIGRADAQVKLRGYRIELGEIESQLARHPAIKEAVALVREDNPGDKRLVAYYTVATTDGSRSTVEAENLRVHLSTALPGYMMPAAYIELEALPLTPNGKLDRRALPALPVRTAEKEGGYLASGTPVQEIVAGIFEEVLKLERVGIHGNFFELGGHSLLAIQVVALVENAFGVGIGVGSVFENATVEELARKIEEAIREGKNMGAPPLVRAERWGQGSSMAPPSFAQQRLWFIDQLEPGASVYIIFEGLRLEGTLNLQVLERAINEVVRRHEVLRTRFETYAGEPVQVIDAWEPQGLEVVDLTGLTPEEREVEISRRAREESGAGFDLSRGPLFRVKVLKLQEEEHVLLYTMSHIVSDAWSMVALVREVSTLYQAISEGKESPLPELKIQYADYAIWQRRYLKGEALEKHLQYWKKQLDGKLPVINLPGDRPRPPVPSYRGAATSIRLPAKLGESLKVLSRREGVTMSMVLLAAFKAMLYKYTAQDDIIVGISWLNRDRSETQPLIGFFVNMLPIRTNLEGNPRFVELLMRVKDVMLGAYTHQELPFEKLVEEIQPERKVGQMPLYNIVFGVDSERREKEEFGLKGLKISRIGVGRGVAKVDLMLWVTESDEEMWAKWTYSADLFEEETIVRMHGHFETLLLSIVARPDAPLDELEILSEAERAQQAISRAARRELNYDRFRSIKPRAIPFSEG